MMFKLQSALRYTTLSICMCTNCTPFTPFEWCVEVASPGGVCAKILSPKAPQGMWSPMPML